MDKSKVIVDHLTKEQIDRSNLSKFQQFKIEKEYATSAYKNYLAHQLFYTVSMLTRTIYQSVLYEYADAIPPEKWAILDLMDEVVSDSEERLETGQKSISQEEEIESSNNGHDDSDSSSDPWQRLGAETKEGGPKDPAIQFPGIDIKIDLPPTIFTPYDHTKTDLAQEAKANADRARAEADRQHEQARQAQEAKQAAMDAAKAAKEDVERKAEALDKLVEKTTEHKADLVDTAKDVAAATLGAKTSPTNPIGTSKTRVPVGQARGLVAEGASAIQGKGHVTSNVGRNTLAEKGTEAGLTTLGVVIIDAVNNGRVQATAEAQKEAIEQFKEDLKSGMPRDEALERAQEKLETGVKDYKEVGYNERAGTTGRTYTDVTKEQTIEETIKALEEYADAKEKEAEATKEQSEALTQAGIESAKEEMAEERAQAAEREAEQAGREAQESETTSSFDDNNTNTTNTGEDTPECGSDCASDCGTDTPPCSDCGSDCSSDCSSDCGDCGDCGSDCGSDCTGDCPADTEACGGCDCDDCGALGAD